MQQPQNTLFDMIMAGGIAGFCTMTIAPMLWLLSGILLYVVPGRRISYLPFALSFLPLGLGLAGTAYGYVLMKQTIAAAGTPASPERIADSVQLAWITTWLGIAGAVPLFLMGTVGLLVKRPLVPGPPEPAPEAQPDEQR